MDKEGKLENRKKKKDKKGLEGFCTRVGGGVERGL